MVIHLDWAFHSSTRSGPKPRKKGDALRMVMVFFLARSQRRTYKDNHMIRGGGGYEKGREMGI